MNDIYGNAVPGIMVIFTAAATSASGTFASSSIVTTNTSGIAVSPVFSANNKAGDYTVTAAASGMITQNFNLTNIPGAAYSIALVSGNNQSAVVNAAFSSALQARVMDKYGNGVPDASVAFAAPAAGASGTFATPSTLTTDSSGLATAPAFMANIVAGIYQVSVTSTKLPSQYFSLINKPAAASSLIIYDGNNQAATLGTSFAKPLQVIVKDTYGNPVPDVSVSFTAPSVGATGTFASSSVTSTNSIGISTSPVFMANTTAGTYSVSATVMGLMIQDFTMANIYGANILMIQSMLTDASAVTLRFNQAIATGSIHIADTYVSNILTEQGCLIITDSNNQIVKGSMMISSDAKLVTFIKSGSNFSNGIYSIRLRSNPNAFRTPGGDLLDGNGDSIPGGDYVSTFTVANNSRILSIPDVVRGPGQALQVNTTDTGIPVKINDGTNIYAFEISVEYNPTLMTVSNVVVPSSLSNILQITYNMSTAGRIDVVGVAINGLPTGAQKLFLITGTVPNSSLYRSKAELKLSNVNLYNLDNNTVPVTLDHGIQLVSYIGDVTGDGRYNSLDPLRLQRHLVNLDRWFAQFPLVDPLLVADVTGDGKVNALDALYMQRYLVNLPVPYLSAPPVTSVTQSGLDPIIRLPKNLSAMRGQVVQVPVELQNTDSQAINVNSFEVAVQIDPHAFRLMKIKSSDKIRTNYDDVRGILIIAGILPEVTLQPGESMIICSLQIKISAHTKATDYVLNLLEDVTIGRAHYATSVNGGTLKLVPAPTNESNDSVDGNIRILERPNRFVSRETFRKSPILKKPRFGFIAR